MEGRPVLSNTHRALELSSSVTDDFIDHNLDEVIILNLVKITAAESIFWCAFILLIS